MSLSSDFIRFSTTSLASQWKFKTRENMQFYLKYLRSPVDQRPPPMMYAIATIRQQWVMNRPVFHLHPRGQWSGRHLLFLHGGSFVNPMLFLHWQFIYRLMVQTSCSVSVPLYGLVPRFNHRDGYALLRQHYSELLKGLKPESIMLMGDSAGGGLALGFSQWIPEQGLPQVAGVVMISPWLDLTLSNPDIAKVQQRDSLLAAPGNQEAGRLWAAGRDPREPQLSPISGPLEGLPPLCLMIGTDDILLPDARRLRERVREAGVHLTYDERPGLYHLWAMLPVPEGAEAMRTVQSFIGTQTPAH